MEGRERHNKGGMPQPLLDGLNPAQRKAATHPGGALLILAGAGTGKTRTITRRVAHLVSSCGVAPGRILAITFTNKAAKEMRNRIAQVVPSTGIWVSTFHATCARMLRQDAEAVGRTRDFSIQDVDDRRKTLRRIIKDQGWDPMIYKPRKFEQLISNWKQRRMDPGQAAEEASLHGVEAERCALVYEKYEKVLRKTDSLDFDDLLLKGLELVEKDAQGVRRWATKFDHILVDEYQDTNELQYLFVKYLAAATGNLTVCGDPDQSIYRWRGADIENILRFEKDYSGTEVVRLEQNYRSVGNVLKAAQAVIKNNRQRKEKDLVTDQEDGEPVSIMDGADEEQEATRVAQVINRWVDGGTSAREIAIFYRTNACSRSLEAALTRMQIPYQVIGGLSFFERQEVKDLLAYARLAVNPKDDMAALRVLNTPPRGIGATSVERIRASAAQFDESVFQVLRRDDVRQGLRGPSKKGTLAFLSVMAKVTEDLSSAEGVLRRTIDRVGYRRFAESLSSTEDVDRGENIDELLAFAQEYDAREDGGLRGFLEEISLLTDVDRWEEGAERISLMTVHAAKGLEFDKVAVVGLEEGLFPHARSFEDPESMEEERRLFYVALTRARKELCLSHSRMRFRTGDPGPQSASRFLDELPDEVLPAAAFSAQLTEQVFEEDAEDAELRPGDDVEHRVFGEGIIQKVLGTGVNQRLVVEFENGSERTLLAAYSMLEKVT
jgi:DNA helicase-2/ATP-dependent DNA helicase PcrA